MADEKYTFEQAKIRLEEIAALARKKDTSLEKSLDLLEEGVRLANICTDLVDHTDLSATATVEVPDEAAAAELQAADAPTDVESQPSADEAVAPAAEADAVTAEGDGSEDA